MVAAGEPCGAIAGGVHRGACSPIERCCRWSWPAAPAEAPARTADQVRRDRCAAFAADGARTARVAGAALHAALGDPSTMNAQAGRVLAAAGEQVEREMLAKCMQWRGSRWSGARSE